MTPESKAFLRYVASQPKGRVGYSLEDWERAQDMGRELIARGFIKPRRMYRREGFQITEQGRAYLGGEA